MVVLDVAIFQIVMPKIFEVLYQPVAAVFFKALDGNRLCYVTNQ